MRPIIEALRKGEKKDAHCHQAEAHAAQALRSELEDYAGLTTMPMCQLGLERPWHFARLASEVNRNEARAGQVARIARSRLAAWDHVR